jgi:hypothetical protein
MLPVLTEFKDVRNAEMVKIYGQRLAERVLFISHSATASSCTLVINALRDSYGSTAELKDY